MSKTEFGKYRIIAELGHGGMANVFLAAAAGPEGLGFTKLVVIKQLRQDLADDPDFVAMLIDEGRLAARLNHPNAVQTYEIGEADGQYYIAMEYLDGQPLSRIDARSRKTGQPVLPLAQSLGVVADLLAGLHHAHELRDYDGTRLGVVHRDVTPQNVFVTYDGQAKIVDFGIAKARGNAYETRHGVLKGKVVYMAPEQASLREIDRRADVFSVGAMLWEVVAGKRMWSGDEENILRRLVNGDLPGPPSTVQAGVDPKLDAICQRALAWDPAERYATAEEMAGELVAWLNEHGGRPAARDIGATLADAFAGQRARTRDLIEERLADLKRGVDSAVKIRALAALGSGAHEALGSEKVALVRSLVSSPPESGDATALSASKQGDGAPSDRPSRSRARSLLIATAGAAVAVGVVFGAGPLVRAPSTASAPPPAKVEAPFESASPVVPAAPPELTASAPAPSAPPRRAAPAAAAAPPRAAPARVAAAAMSTPAPTLLVHPAPHAEASAARPQRPIDEDNPYAKK